MIYLDNASTTPLHDEVLNEMLPYFKDKYGNPSSLHRIGREANNALVKARSRIRKALNLPDGKIIFTSGATEANNLALKGVMNAYKSKGKHLIVSKIEHESILEPAKRLEEQGYEVSYISVDQYGIIDLDEFEKSIRDDTILASIMLVNNEIGTIEPLKDIIEIAHKHGVMVHSDIVQATGKMSIDVKDLDLDLLTISAHKMYGPKGVGALFAKDRIMLKPIIDGGGHEYNLRSGTQNVPAIVGLGKVFELAKSFDYSRVKELRDYMIKALLEIPESRLNGHPSKRVANNVNVSFKAVNGEDLIIKLSEKGIAASTGSACSTNKQKASHVLKALGLSYEEVTGSLRLTLGLQNTKEEIDKAIEAIDDTVKELRRLSPFAKPI